MFYELFFTFSIIIGIFSIILVLIKEFTELCVFADGYNETKKLYEESCLREIYYGQVYIGAYEDLTRIYQLDKNDSINALYQLIDQRKLVVYKTEYEFPDERSY